MEGNINTIQVKSRMGLDIIVQQLKSKQFMITIPQQVAKMWSLEKGDTLVLDQDINTGIVTIRKKVPQEADHGTK